MNFDDFNAMAFDVAQSALQRCCGSQRWVEEMLIRRPFRTPHALFAAADDIWSRLDQTDWLEAFAAHPRIGDLDSSRQRFSGTAEWCGAEQAGVATANEETLRSLAECNRHYELRFGYIFIVCATGKTADEMLTLLRARMTNEPEKEMRIAADEQRKITRLRLEKL